MTQFIIMNIIGLANQNTILLLLEFTIQKQQNQMDIFLIHFVVISFRKQCNGIYHYHHACWETLPKPLLKHFKIDVATLQYLVSFKTLR